MATIYDVAKRAGVSPKTVSRVLNDDGPVSVATRAAVTAAMEALGYVPSFAARSIKSRKSGLIGLITGAITSATDAADAPGLPDLYIVQGIQHTLQHSDKTLLITDTGRRLERVPELINAFRQHRVEGLLYVADCHQRLAIPLSIDHVPKVLVNCFDEAGTPSVLPDDEAGQHSLTRDVVAAGHRRIAYLSLGRALVATGLRLQGYRTALKEAGIAVDPALIAPIECANITSARQLIWDALARFFRLADPPTIICCGNDRLAMTVYGMLRERGMRIPEDISVTGYDDHRIIAEALHPALTTVELPYAAMGARAAQLLLDLIETGDADRRQQPLLVGGPVRRRGSLAAPARSHPAVVTFDRRRTP